MTSSVGKMVDVGLQEVERNDSPRAEARSILAQVAVTIL
jgi:hypothetical protein